VILVPFPKELVDKQEELIVTMGVPDEKEWGVPHVFDIPYMIPFPKLNFLLQDAFVSIRGIKVLTGHRNLMIV
tara:strand:- start:145 stop:363 length:219 start_codon:yes stop_codon:yes gene_type:complete